MQHVSFCVVCVQACSQKYAADGRRRFAWCTSDQFSYVVTVLRRYLLNYTSISKPKPSIST